KKMFSEGKILIDGTGITKDMHSYSYSKALFDGDVKFIGFPTADKRKAVIKPLPPSLAITTSSDEKDAAWDFVKSVITDDAAQVYDIADGIPSGKEPFEQLVKRLTATEKYTDEDGAIVEPLSGFGGTNEFEYAFTPFSEEEINRIRDMIKNAAVKTDNSVILSIVEAELNDYFDGRKNLDELINVLQDRVGKYVNENK
ncbi:MAG: hypothetical protein HFH14_02335, partial [Lachnospiraceae bacterium]|nr:hypothetical protein [Lachnospiraceae bacterium]